MDHSSKKRSDRDRLADLGFLAASLAHEIKNPLAALQLSVQTVRHLLEDSDVPAAAREQLAVMEKTVLRANRLAEQMVGFAKDLPDRPRTLSLKDAVDEVLTLYSYQLVLCEIQVESRIDAQATVFADADRLAQALINLLNNAIRALLERPSGRRIEIKAAAAADNICLEVWNNGPPVAPGAEFGIGLTVVRDFLRAAGGRLEHTSSETGVRFVFLFPKFATKAA